MIPFVNLSKQYKSLKKEIDGAVSRVLEQGWFILGEELESFEKEFASFCGTEHAVGVGSGTEALHLALLACGVEPGDEVITVPNISAPTVAAVCFAEAKPVFVDINPDTYTMDPRLLRNYLKKKTKSLGSESSAKMPKAVVPVHLYGHPADMDGIMEVAGEYSLKVVEDACQAHGAEFKGKKAGTFGDAGCFSFYPTKNIGAYGDAGMAVTSKESLARKIFMLRNYGEEKKYSNTIKGFNSRLDEIQAAVLRVKLKHLDEWTRIRREYAALYSRHLTGLPVKTPVEIDGAKHVFHLYVIRSSNRDALLKYLKEKGILCSVHYPLPLHLQKAYRDLGYAEGDFPVSERCAKEVLSLPLYPEMTREEVKIVIRALREFHS